MSFRYDINGLRAIAVIAVVLFHFDPTWVPGGFAGVDVFFVISGFLMTGIIFKGLESDNFNLFKFYVARANRIIPALAVLCLILLVFGWFYATPFDYRTLGKHVASSMGFLSNVLYWQESGYFDAASHEKWLLHTWSLSVEWQFYIIYPIVLVTLKRFLSLKSLKRLIVIGTIVGFGLSVVVTMKWPNLAYYLLPTRAWEMMMGGVAFLYPWNISETKKKVIEALGLLLIIISYAFVSSDIPWPGYFALAPVLGSYLMIVANQQSSVLTNNLVFQYLGKWSYSIYLWHWPIVVFGYYFDIKLWYLYGVPLSVFFGFISFTYIERIKFKNHYRWVDSIKVLPLYLTIMLGFIGAMVWKENGDLGQLNFPDKYSGIFQEKENITWKRHIELDLKDEFNSNKTRVLVIGDSQAGDFINILEESSLSNIEIASKIVTADCGIFYIDDNEIDYALSPINNTDYKSGETGTSKCPDKMKRAMDSKLVSQADYILISFWWREEFVKYIKNALNEISKLTNAKIIVVDNKYILSKPSRDIFYRAFTTYDAPDMVNEIGIDFIDSKNVALNEHLNREVRGSGGSVLSLGNKICSHNKCLVLYNNEPVFYDRTHITPSGVVALSNMLDEEFSSLFNLL